MSNLTSNNNDTAVVDIDKEDIVDMIIEIRGHRVMLDRDIASYFGTATGNLNRAMKRNLERFPVNFCFQLTAEECSRFQIGILNEGRGSNLKYLPYAYTEQGVAMLTSVLHTERAINASISIMEAFVEMSHHIRRYRGLIPSEEILALSNRQYLLENEIDGIKESMVTKDDLSEVMRLLAGTIADEDMLILDGEPLKADAAYRKIFKNAKYSIILVDDYLGVKTLSHLSYCRPGVRIIIVSDNKSKPPLTHSDYTDFRKEHPNTDIKLISSAGRVHDRFIVLDFEASNQSIFHCGSSIKDSGNKITSIIRIRDTGLYSKMIAELLDNHELSLNDR